MIIKATQKNIPVAPRKIRIMVAAIKHLKPQEAIEQLALLNYSAAQPVMQTIMQAIANATNNSKLNPSQLVFKEIFVGKGINIKRVRAAARGRRKPYSKLRSHLTITLEDIAPKVKITKKTTKKISNTK